MQPLAVGFSIFTISLAVVLLEIAFTRIFSFKVYYYFTYLIIGLSLLGLGAGGIAFALSRALRTAALQALIPICCVAAGLLVAGGYAVIAPMSLEVSALATKPVEIAKLAFVAVLLFLPFLLSGIAVSAILSNAGRNAHRFYGADLLGAGLGCALAVPLMMALTPPGAVVASGVLLSLSGLPLAWNAASRPARWAPLVAAIGIAAWPLGVGLPDPAVDPSKNLRDYRKADLVVHSEWSPVFRIDVSRVPLTDDAFMIQHDGQLGSSLHRFDGDVRSLDRFESDVRSIPFAPIKRSPRVLIIGAAGGHEILASLYFGAEHVTAVELNPATVRLLTEHFADYSGRLHENDRVRLVNGEGRSFLKREEATYDLIWLVAPDSYAAMNAASSAAFVLSESYLYTAEMIQDSLSHLAPGGVLCAQFGELNFDRKPNRTARFVNTARASMATGDDGFGRHVLVSTTEAAHPFGLATVLLSRDGFSDGQILRFGRVVEDLPQSKARHPLRRGVRAGPVNEVIDLPDGDLQDWLEGEDYRLEPVTDDAPFFWHFVRFRDAFQPRKGVILDWEDAIGERVLVILVGLVTLLAGVFLVLPVVAIREVWTQMPHKRLAFTYFAALGTGFMMIEVCLIQMLILFLGYPTYSLSVTLFGLLVFSGIGSLASGRYREQRDRALVVLLGCLALVVLFLQLGLPRVVEVFGGAPIALRVVISVAMLAPAGICMGAFLPLGLDTIAARSPHPREYVAWAWAVNGFFSVITSIASTIVAMTIGFRLVLLIGLAIYVVGVAALRRIPAPSPAERVH